MRELLLCPPDYYGIEYEINPWMSRARGAETELAQSQWQGLHQTLASLDNKIELVPPQPKLPDMVFTANAGLAVGKKFIPSNFRHQERAGEAPYFVRWMEEQGYEIHRLPENLYFEGEGDALFAGDALFCGYKFRSDIQSHRAVAEMLGCLVISVELVDPRFYHLDTCFCPLPDGGAVWFPAAFDEYGQRAIARGADAKPQGLQTRSTIGIGVNHATHPFFLRHRPPAPVEIEPFRSGVELDPAAGFRRGFEHRRDVDGVTFAFQQQPAGRMRQHRHERIRNRANDTLRHF